MVALIDTNILVYRFDPRDPQKQQIAEALLRDGIERDSVRIPHQAIFEFVAACARNIPGGPLLDPQDARREAEELLSIFEVLYPNEAIVRTAVRGAAAYQLAWFDAPICGPMRSTLGYANSTPKTFSMTASMGRSKSSIHFSRGKAS